MRYSSPHLPPGLENAVRAFRDATGAAADGRATRARIVAVVSGRMRRRLIWRKTALVAAVILLPLASGSVAWTALGRWRDRQHSRQPPQASVPPPRRGPLLWAPAPLLVDPAVPSPSATHARLSSLDRPARGDSRASGALPSAQDEHTTYARAHQAHFVDQSPKQALAAWDAYLRHYPRGTFAPEAQYNRALCLVKLQRWDAAAAALNHLMAGEAGGTEYRREEAQVLLEWIAAHHP